MVVFIPEGDAPSEDLRLATYPMHNSLRGRCRSRKKKVQRVVLLVVTSCRFFIINVAPPRGATVYNAVLSPPPASNFALGVVGNGVYMVRLAYRHIEAKYSSMTRGRVCGPLEALSNTDAPEPQRRSSSPAGFETMPYSDGSPSL